MNVFNRTVGHLAVISALVFALVLQSAVAASLPDFTVLVEEQGKTVVNISTKQHIINRQLQRYDLPEIPENSPFGELFRHFFGTPGGMPDQAYETTSLGSGFIISDDGYIMTNHHVVAEADEIIVRTSDRREYLATVIGSDKRSDVALIKIDAENLPVAEFGDAEALKVGEWVLAIGSPFGFEQSVTAGIVSAKRRALPRENYVPFIQTDVAINPGNSGGPLFNLAGQVVGINSQIYSRTGGFMGLSFAIPINVAKDVADQLKSKGRVTRGWLGVLIQDVTRELAESFGMSQPRGALVARVLPDSPAADAKLLPGDVVLKFDGKEVPNSAALPPLVGMARVDRPAEVVILRNGIEMTTHVTIGELPQEDDQILTQSLKKEPTAGRLGMVVMPLNDELREQIQVQAGHGVMVEAVKKGAAAKAGVEAGDVILMIDSQQVTSVEQFASLVEALPVGKSVAVLLQRRSGPIFLAIKVPTE
ncbi:MAG: Do family serine endopeptidase [Candidatus Polarisedimenticolaceae bacterium]|nr:Do family serine endopeptidase [Candidatus Polarisedimenticolaceae bacterium]